MIKFEAARAAVSMILGSEMGFTSKNKGLYLFAPSNRENTLVKMTDTTAIISQPFRGKNEDISNQVFMLALEFEKLLRGSTSQLMEAYSKYAMDVAYCAFHNDEKSAGGEIEVLTMLADELISRGIPEEVLDDIECDADNSVALAV